MNRREFLTTSLGATAGVGLAASLAGKAAAQEDKKHMKALQLGNLPKELSLDDKFKMTLDVGFDGLEGYPMELDEAKAMRDVVEATGCPVHSLTYGGWGSPMSSGDPEVIKKGQAEIEGALRAAQAVGAETVLLVPAVVNAGTRYAEAYERSQKNIRPLIPLAEELDVIIAIENVWNKFLLSPIEFAEYVDEFESDHVKAYFDIGNVVIFGWPEDWIRTLGDCIVKCHLKDFKREGYQWKPLREGDVDWGAVMSAINDVGYEGWFTTEVGGGDEAWLKDLAQRVDLCLAGE